MKIKSEWGEKEIKEEKTMEREEIRKNALDPMNGILKTTIRVSNSILIGSEQFDGEILKIKEEPRESPAQYSPQVTQSSTSKNSESRRNSIGGKNNYDNANRINKDSNDGVSNYNCQDSSGNTDYIGNKRPNKKTSHSDREKKRKRTREYSDNDSNNSSSSSSGARDSSSSSSSGSHVPDMYSKVIIKGEIVSDRYETKISDRKCTNDSNTNSSIALLRLKRIEREYVERKRAALLLAKVDIYGPPLNMTGVGNLPDGREQRYHQQFHPHIAR